MIDTCSGCGAKAAAGSFKYAGGESTLLCPLCHQKRRVKEIVGGAPVPLPEGEDKPVSFKVGDTVRIVRQPPNQWVQVAGLIGFVDEIQGEGLYYVECLDSNGSVTGGGSVPGFCLEAFDAQDRKAKHDEQVQTILQRSHERAKQIERSWKDGVEALATKHGLDPSVVNDIGTELEQVRKQWGDL